MNRRFGLPSRKAVFEAAYRHNYSALVATATRRLPSREAAEDCVQEVFRVVWKRMNEHSDALVEPTAPFLFASLRNVIGTHYRTEQRRTALTKAVANEPVDSSSVVDAVDERIFVLEVMNRLSDDFREVLQLSYWDDLTGAELAAFLGLSEAGVRTRLFRARNAFLEELQRMKPTDARTERKGAQSNG